MARGKKKRHRGGRKKSAASSGSSGSSGSSSSAAAEKEPEGEPEESGTGSEEEEEEELTTEELMRREARARARAQKEAKRRARAAKEQRKQELAALGGPAKVRLRHILVKHTESRNCFSKRTMHEVTTTPSEARGELEEMLATLKAIEGEEEMREKFIEFATLRSDCDTHKEGGDMGLFPRGNMHPHFDEVAFGLKVGQLSDQIVETDSGLHLLLRIG
eukprot:g4748.t1